MAVIYITDPEGELVKCDDERPLSACVVDKRLLLMIDSYNRAGAHDRAKALHGEYLSWKRFFASNADALAGAEREANREMRLIQKEREERAAEISRMRSKHEDFAA